MRKVVVDQNHQQRLDVFAHTQLPELSRSSVQKLIDEKRITVNGNKEKTGYKLKQGDAVTIDFDSNSLKDVPDIDLPVLYEDDDCIVINKPAGVLTHSKGAFNPEATVASFVRNKVHFPANDDPNDRAGIVHRLDRATSGVIICAKTPAALKWLQKQFAQRKVKKTYIAIIEGQLEPATAVIDMPIARNPRNPKTFRVATSGKPAKTLYRTDKTTPSHSMLILEPETGRTHQLRVHLAQLGHPIVGDELYDGAPAKRMMLHANKLEITLPNRQRHTFVAEIPQTLQNSLV